MLCIVASKVGCAPRTLSKQRVHACVGAAQRYLTTLRPSAGSASSLILSAALSLLLARLSIKPGALIYRCDQ